MLEERRAQGARASGAGRVDAGAVHDRGDRARGARGRRLGLRRAGPRVRCWSTIRTTPGSHEALALVAEHRGDAPTARAERALVANYWKNADPDLKK